MRPLFVGPVGPTAIGTLVLGVAPLAAAAPHDDPILPPGFVVEHIHGPDTQITDVAVDPNGTVYFSKRRGWIWAIANGTLAPAPLLDICDEVGNFGDHGLNSFTLDPDYQQNGYVYVYYVVDYHHLVHFGTPSYDPDASEPFRDTIARLTRYTVLDPSDPFTTVDPQSRLVLLGEDIASGVPICSSGHGIGTVRFGSDGTLLLSSGDAFLPGGVMSDTCVADGILDPKEDLYVFVPQLVDSHAGKILRLDAATGDGLPSNPFFDASEPRAPRSRVWSLGLRNPFRFAVRPGTGSSNPVAADPGSLYIGDVGALQWEELDVSNAPAQNFGWPLYHGLLENAFYFPKLTENPDAPNPLFGQTGCDQPFFHFQELLVQETQNTPSWPNPCDPGQPVPESIPRFEHTRPAIAWAQGDFLPDPTAHVPDFDANGAAVVRVLGTPESPATGAALLRKLLARRCVVRGGRLPGRVPGSLLRLRLRRAVAARARLRRERPARRRGGVRP